MIADGGPSVTARRVAAHRLAYDRIPWRHGDPAADDALTADVAAGVDVSQGGMHRYLGARTTFFDSIVVGALDRGIRQIVTGGAGYDGRALRYATPGVRWFEVDHPATQRDKVSRLRRLGIATDPVSFVAADFNSDDVPGPLRAAGLDPAAATLFLLEGVAVYLAPDVLERLLGEFRTVAEQGSTLAISMPLTGTARAGPRFREAVASMGEPALSRFEPAEAEDLLARCGWRVAASDPAAAGKTRAVGLLTAHAGPRAAAPTQPAATPPAPTPPAAGLALSALLSHALVAFTIEADNEAEHLMPHHTSDRGPGSAGDGPWQTSLAMYENCLRYLDEPRTVAELRNLARTGTNLDGMRRWGYVTIDGSAKARRGSGGALRRPGPGAILRLTAAGQRAREVWAPLPALIEDRWRERYGAPLVSTLRDVLDRVVGHLDPTLPDCLPILGHGMFSRLLDPPPAAPAGRTLPLHALMSRALLAIAVEYERESGLSLAISANVLRPLTAEGIRLRDLPHLSGISKEAVAMAMGILETRKLAVTVPDPAGGRGTAGVRGDGSPRWKTARLTPAGTAAQPACAEHLATCERWLEALDPAAAGAMRDVLTELPLAAPEPYPDGWRASVRRPAVLPHYPVVLHRGGYPDGS
ncbi:MAG TPA: SAM-dependent methyltransferase [Streptosporangiaceae bacterium]|nr:SAM-dependent methyltransferase [Streptosporangiaceae bacterium]